MLQVTRHEVVQRATARARLTRLGAGEPAREGIRADLPAPLVGLRIVAADICKRSVWRNRPRLAGLAAWALGGITPDTTHLPGPAHTRVEIEFFVRTAADEVPVRLVYSSRTLADVMGRFGLATLIYTFLIYGGSFPWYMVGPLTALFFSTPLK